ncbi:PAS domain-containing protein [archaeon]|jgi:PAS domain-containing protein|nr:PAS domain-containing protein [archaeon]
MKLATILIMSFILMGLIGSLSGTYYFYSQSEALLEERIIEGLQSTAAALENFIDKFLEEQEDKIRIAATHGDLTNEELKEIRDLQEEFYEVFVLDSKGIIIVSSEESQIGKDKSNDAYFINARDKIYIKPAYLSESTKKQSISVSTPFHEGVLVARIELEAFEEIISDKTGLGETGESLLGYNDEHGQPVFFTELRFEEEEEEEDGKHIVLPIEEALAGKEEVFLDSHDYRHVNVIAVTRYIEAIDVGMVVKFDDAEAFGVARDQLMKTSIYIIIAILISFSIVGFFIARFVSKPIAKLTSDVDEVTKGKLDIQLSKSGIYEVQKLTNSLNRILASLKLAILKTGSGKEELGLGEIVKSKKEAEEKYKILYESSRDAIMILEPPTWNFTAGNPATVKMFGAKDEKEFISKTPGDLSPKKQIDGQLSSVKAKKMIEGAMKKGSNSFYWTHKKIDGEDFLAQVLLTKFKLDGKDVLQATVRDLSKKKVVKNVVVPVKKIVDKKVSNVIKKLPKKGEGK